MSNYRSGYLEQGSPVSLLKKVVSLTADNTLVDGAPFSVLEIYSDNTTAGNRTFTLTNGAQDMQVLTLYLASGSSTAAQLADSGNVLLSAAWEPTQGDTLTLLWSQVLTKWCELSRADV